MTNAGHVKVAPRKPQTGRVKLKISPDTGEAFYWVKGKNSTGSDFTGSDIEGCLDPNLS